MAGERCEGSARGRVSVPVVHHVIYCYGCRRAWVDAEYEAGGWFSIVIGGGCACACLTSSPA